MSLRVNVEPAYLNERIGSFGKSVLMFSRYSKEVSPLFSIWTSKSDCEDRKEDRQGESSDFARPRYSYRRSCHDCDVTPVSRDIMPHASAMIVTSRQFPRNFTPILTVRDLDASRTVQGKFGLVFLFFFGGSAWLEDCQVCFSSNASKRMHAFFASVIRSVEWKYERLF